MEPGVLHSDPKLRFNDQEWTRGYVALERLNSTAKDTSFLQNITDVISKGILENISGFFSKKNTENNSAVWQKNIEQDSDEELSNRMSKLSINKAISRQVKKEIKKTSQYRCSNCNRTGHNSRKCTHKKMSKNRSKKSGNINKIVVDSDSSSDTDSSDNDSSDNNTDSEETSSESEADINVNITHLKKK